MMMTNERAITGGLRTTEFSWNASDFFGVATAVVVFFGTWIYCAFSYDLIFGVGLGWLPGIVLGLIAGLVMSVAWPLLFFGVGWIAFVMFVS